MKEEIQRIIARMSPIELVMIEQLGIVLPRRLAWIAADFRAAYVQHMKLHEKMQLRVQKEDLRRAS